MALFFVIFGIFVTLLVGLGAWLQETFGVLSTGFVITWLVAWLFLIGFSVLYEESF